MLNEILCVLLSSPLAWALAEFFVPGPGPSPRWTVGDTQEIRYKTTYTKYTIALWQQFDDEGAAELGPVLFRMYGLLCDYSWKLSRTGMRLISDFDAETSQGPGQNFDWLVQTYDFNLDRSNKFFLWLYEGESSAQGNGSFENQSSGYFFISEASTTTTTAEEEPTTTSSSIPSTTGVESAATSEPPPQSPSTTDGDLSTGAKAGVGVGAGVSALAIISAVVLFFRYRSRKKKELEELRSLNNHRTTGNPSWNNKSKTALPDAHVPSPPSYELPAHGYDMRERAELG